jgi:dethiobiotin synthetase
MKQRFFITATGTGIGKSFITAALVRQAKALKRTVMAYKPVISGFDGANPDDSDTGLIIRSLGLATDQAAIERVSPWRYVAPLGPSMAARLENCLINFEQLVTQTHNMLDGPEELVLIEGVGGVMVPLTDHHTVLDWIAKLDVPCLLVTGSYLGALSHTLTAIETLRQRRISVRALIVNQSAESEVSLAATVSELGHWAQYEIITVMRQSSTTATPDISELQTLLI